MHRLRHPSRLLGLLTGLFLLAGCQEKSNESFAEIKGVAPPPAAESGIDRTNQQTYAESMKTKMGNPYAAGGYPKAEGRR